MFLISDLCGLAEAYLTPEQIKEIYRAYLFGSRAHEGQQRASGEPYIQHPLQVARILTEMRLDAPTIVAAILHDVIEDTKTAKDQIVQEFGEEVAELVDGVSKLTHLSFQSKAEAQAENFRKMMLAMSRDIRVILIKLADRLHNMRTLSALDSRKRRLIARETLDIYAPIANRVGLNRIRTELEDLGFEALYPRRYRVFTARMKRARGNRKQAVKRVEDGVRRRLRQEGLAGKVSSRERHPYSLYRKMRDKGLSLSEVLDVHAFRITVDNADTCYRVLGVLHSLYKPVPGRFKDYIALPKPNGYQSLHTMLFGPFGAPIEFQIRTRMMDAVAETGIAAHWIHKSGNAGASTAEKHTREWIKGLLEIQTQAGDSIEFLENVKVDLFPKEIYVYTPAGDIMALPRGASPVDLAYAVHTEVGNTCVAASVDGHEVPLHSTLTNGQTVKVETDPDSRPSANWLDFVVTGKARAGVRGYLKRLRTEEAVKLGRRLLERSLALDSLGPEEVCSERLASLLDELNHVSLDGLLEEIGLGKRLAPLVARRLVPSRSEPESGRTRSDHPLYVRGSEGMVISFGKCCYPIPGDAIVGYVSAGRGLVVHVSGCRNVREHAGRPENWVEVAWEGGVDGEFPVEIRVDVANRKGMLATVAAAIAERDSNIENVSMENRDALTATLNFVINVRDRLHLAQVIRHIRSLGEASRIARSGGEVRRRRASSRRFNPVSRVA